MRLLSKELVTVTMAELGIGRGAYVIENRGRRLIVITRRGEQRTISLELQIGESESAAIARISRVIHPEPVFLDI